MALWGRNDQAVSANSTTTRQTSNGAPTGTSALVKVGGGANAHFGNTSPGSRAAFEISMFGNTTPGAFIPNRADGIFGADVAETTLASGNLAFGRVVFGGSGYSANATVTVTATNGGTSGAANAFANVSATVGGRVTAINITANGSGYVSNPSITISAPTALNVTANTSGVNNAADTILLSTADSRFQAGDRFFYGVPAGNTAIGGMIGNTFYFVTFANTTALAVSTSASGSNVNINELRATAGETHTLTGDTATGVIVVNGGKNKGIAHAGWVLRTEGAGGRAGRVQYETLVAMNSLGAQTASYGTPALVADAADDAVLPDA